MLRKFLVLACFLVATHLSAASLSMGRDGEPFTEEGIKWQPVHYSSDERYVKANLPGEPRSVMSSDGIYMYSNYDNAIYELQIQNMFPEKPEEGKKQLEKTSGLKVTKIVKAPQPGCLYAIEYQLKTDNSSLKGRLFATKKGAYLALSNGEVAEAFFESVKFSQ